MTKQVFGQRTFQLEIGNFFMKDIPKHVDNIEYIYSKLRDKIQLNFKIVSGNVSGTSLELMRVVPYGWIWNRYPGPGRNRLSLDEKKLCKASKHALHTQRKSFKCLLYLNASCRFTFAEWVDSSMRHRRNYSICSMYPFDSKTKCYTKKELKEIWETKFCNFYNQKEERRCCKY